MADTCTHCHGPLVVGPPQREGDACTHDLTCPEHGRQWVTSTSLLSAVCPLCVELPLFRESA